jgi:hypothetical protein
VSSKSRLSLISYHFWLLMITFILVFYWHLTWRKCFWSDSVQCKQVQRVVDRERPKNYNLKFGPKPFLDRDSLVGPTELMLAFLFSFSFFSARGHQWELLYARFLDNSKYNGLSPSQEILESGGIPNSPRPGSKIILIVFQWRSFFVRFFQGLLTLTIWEGHPGIIHNYLTGYFILTY